ncbi:pyridoxal phosphate-dependent aminotransferase [Halobacillus halophilus]|uniref:Aminotransferase n=1 Tax=Halobacillus halophilus (strain ATCC 35676 / DSM 2266 / JCM 20832 / KCTC 3685 / LMG 17431 / NBRC 102448 / NCIMB 2269) TaxID=866895 RepID=I0JJL5_HALH3|nr:aminotransferase class I/II-fold pyridoxal phosphate-dependent enzyme [Halobacillus halophilus]ASF38487.1 pyridoxal phosphate-dependent aminotransferase [Halobacillus halophilus]CCG44333.1 putative aminotransferase [Halobacillus halophilus DSM 2266]
MKNSKIYLSPPHMTGKEQLYINEAFESNWIAPLGRNVDMFEKEIAEYVGAKGAVAVSSGTAAIHLALSLLDVKRGDRVFCSTFTFVASANPILYQGAEPIFIDSEPESWNMSPLALERALYDAYKEGKLPKAVIMANIYGQSGKMDELMTLCDHYRVPIIEDAAESLGSTYHGKHSGSFGDFGVYSFNGNKIITTSGGGMLVSNNEIILEKARFLATQAREQAIYYQHHEVGYNYRMSNILAGIGRAQLEVIEERVHAKREVFKMYERLLADVDGIDFLAELPETRSNRWLTVFTINNLEIAAEPFEVLKSMTEHNIEVRPLWKPLHMQPLYLGTPYYSHSEHVDVSEQLFKTGLCLPSGSNLSEIEQVRVVNCLKESLKGAKRKEGIF